MNLESRLQRLEERLLPPMPVAVGVDFTPSDEVPPPPSDPRARREHELALAMDATIPASPD